MSESLAIQKTDTSDAAALTLVGPDDFDRDVWCVLGLPFDRTDIAGAAEAVGTAARTGRRLSFVTPNTNWLVRGLSDRAARAQILNADLSLADGAPVVAIARLLGVPLPGRAAGSDLFEALKARPAITGRRLRVFFFGGRDGAAEQAAAALKAGNFGVEAVGALNPGHGDIDAMSSPETIAAINAARPDFVLVALGASKGQAWIERNLATLSAPVVAHLGAVVDFTAGTIRRAPKWVARAGLEWAWRIKEERSLWRRYANDGAALAALIMRNVAPQLLSARSVRMAESLVEVALTERGVTVRVSGRPMHASLAPLRRAFREAAAARKDISVDLSGVERCDRAFLGLVLMLEKAARASGVRLSVTGSNRSIRRLFAANGMAYSDASAQDVTAARHGIQPAAPTKEPRQEDAAA